MEIMMIREIKIKYTGRPLKYDLKIDSPKAAFHFAKNLIGDDVQESVLALFLNSKNHPNGYQVVSKGTATETIVHPREVFRGAIMTGAVGVLVLHNHPSGVLSPSKEDEAACERIYETGKIIGIELLDFLIISNKGFLSFRENELL